MRCDICDFSYDTPSMFHDGLQIPRGNYPLFEYKDGSCYCHLCFNSALVYNPGDLELVEEAFDEVQ